MHTALDKLVRARLTRQSLVTGEYPEDPVEIPELDTGAINSTAPSTGAAPSTVPVVETATVNPVGEATTEIVSLASDVEMLRTQLQQIQAQNEQLTATNAQLVVQTETANRLLGNLTPKPEGGRFGAAAFSINPVQTLSSEPTGALRELLSQPKFEKTTLSGRQYLGYSEPTIHNFVRQNMNALVRDTEVYGRAHGWFRGNNPIITQAATTKTDVPPGFLETLGTIMRLNNSSTYTFHQFAGTEFDSSKNEGDSIRFYRSSFLPQIAAIADRRLSGVGTFVAIGPTDQNLTVGSVLGVLEEYGLGTTAAPPIGLPSMVNALSMVDLMRVLQVNLLEDYYAFEDLAIRSLIFGTTNTIYSKNGAVVNLPTAIAAGDDSRMSKSFLSYAIAYAAENRIQPFSNGKYVIVMPPRPLAQLRESYQTGARFYDDMSHEEVSNVLYPAGTPGRVSGYVGMYENCMGFQSNAYGIGAAGTEGVRTQTLGGVAHTTRSSYLIGANPVAVGTADGFSIVQDDQTNFNRLNRYIWSAIQCYTALDVDPTLNANQQLRVVELRTTDIA